MRVFDYACVRGLEMIWRLREEGEFSMTRKKICNNYHA